ncbi:MAG: hypothetical protein KGJ72_10460, partial [Gammaproteobacteria bacterium]|nr:hypothetical protein [Gammaproteobacteria bacterium]
MAKVTKKNGPSSTASVTPIIRSADPGARASQSTQMPMSIPSMPGSGVGSGMPSASTMGSRAAAIMPEPLQTAVPGQMPMPVAAAAGQAPRMGAPTRSPLPRFRSSGPGGGKPATPAFEPGVVEVQFHDGVAPTVMPGKAGAPSEIHGAAVGPLDDMNRLLSRHRLLKAEPTFLTTHEDATKAQATALMRGIDAPHLGHFVTLHFPDDADTLAIAGELSKLPDVERAAPVPQALPPSAAMIPASAEQLPPVPSPLAEPLEGSSDQVVIDPVTGLENQWYIFRCGVNSAWGRSSANSVVVADVDWGCRTSHRDLANVERTYNAFDGSADVTHGGSVFHGTGVLGLAGAAINGLGMAGIGYQAALWPVQADSGTGSALGGNAWARGIDWVRATDAGGKRKVVILEVQTGAFGNYEQV